MTTASVPYTRSAVQLIRNGATAVDLGWPESMYDSVCRTHSIDRRKPDPQLADTPSVRRCGSISFNERTSEVIRAGIVVALPIVQSAAFKVLYDRLAAENVDYISATEVSDLIPVDCTPRNIVFTMRRLNDRLAPLQVWVEGKLGSNGGYRLRVEA